MAAMSEAADFESLNSKSPMPASLLAKKPYFLELDGYREALADDPNASSVDRHNSKERHRRSGLTQCVFNLAVQFPQFNVHLQLSYMIMTLKTHQTCSK